MGEPVTRRRTDDRARLVAWASSPLFSAAATAPTLDGVEPHVTDEDRWVAERLPPFVRFGTSSWSFPGWTGILWKGRASESDLARAGLAAYAAHPLFRAVGVDRSLYGPLTAGEITEYERQIARGSAAFEPRAPFTAVFKVWDEVTTAVFPNHPRYGARAGTRNPHCFDVQRLQVDVLAHFREAATEIVHLFELTPIPPGTFDERTFVAKVDHFISRLPSGHRWAFELRNAELFGRRWLDMLRANGVAHVVNYWTAMPPIKEQLRAGALAAPFTVVRLMMPPFTRYATRAVTLAPFDAIVETQTEMREDLVALLRAAADAGTTQAIVLVGNKAEGSAPLTVRALARMTAAAFADTTLSVCERR